MKTLNNYITESKIDQIQGLQGYTISEVNDLLNDYIEDILIDIDSDIEIKSIWLHGSRLRGTAKTNSDLDAVIFYSGKDKEDSLFNAFHDEDTEPMYIEDILVDFNFIKVSSDKEILDYMKKSKDYDKEILLKTNK